MDFFFFFKYRNAIKIIILFWDRKGQLGRNKNFVWRKTEKSAKWICIRCTNVPYVWSMAFEGWWRSKPVSGSHSDCKCWIDCKYSIVLYVVFLPVSHLQGGPSKDLSERTVPVRLIYPQNEWQAFYWPVNYHIQKKLLVKLVLKASCNKYFFSK